MDTSRFKKIIWANYRVHKRDMPWRKTKDSYRILVSEIMLQQTQVSRVRKFYSIFIKQFPSFGALAHAKTSSVLRAWQGLGYNRRALALQRLSRIVLKEFNGRLPQDREALESLPGIGKGTSGAISAFAWDKPTIFIETNIRRVFIHFFFGRRKNVTDKELERYIERTLPKNNFREWYWALMDYGAMLTTAVNPNRQSAGYKKQTTFKGSERELRGKILSLILKNRRISFENISLQTGGIPGKVRKISSVLEREGFITVNKKYISILN